MTYGLLISYDGITMTEVAHTVDCVDKQAATPVVWVTDEDGHMSKHLDIGCTIALTLRRPDLISCEVATHRRGIVLGILPPPSPIEGLVLDLIDHRDQKKYAKALISELARSLRMAHPSCRLEHYQHSRR